ARPPRTSRTHHPTRRDRHVHDGQAVLHARVVHVLVRHVHGVNVTDHERVLRVVGPAPPLSRLRLCHGLPPVHSAPRVGACASQGHPGRSPLSRHRQHGGG